jgi:hypothetical protein
MTAGRSVGTPATLDLARTGQIEVDRARYRDPGGARRTFAELVEERHLPLQTELSPVTRRNVAFHLGDATGRPWAKGGKAERAAPVRPARWLRAGATGGQGLQLSRTTPCGLA